MKHCLSVLSICVGVLMIVSLWPPIVYADDFFDGQVEHILAGDRIVLRGGTVVQYMGIGIPTGSALSTLQKEAAEYNKKLVSKKRVRLEFVIPYGATPDASKRYAYVFVSGQMVNALLLKKGYALVSERCPPDAKYLSYFQRCQNEAVSTGAGIWGLLTRSTNKKRR